MRVATWNVGHPTSPERRERQRLAVGRAAADVLVLTAADSSLVPHGHDVLATPGDADGVHAVVLSAARLEPLDAQSHHVVAHVDDHLVVAVRLSPTQHDLRALDHALDRADDRPLVLVGAFGQTLTGHVVGSRVGRELLQGLLRRHALTAHTAHSPSARAGCAAVDHVCSTTPARSTSTWSSVDAEAGLVLSEHLAYVVDL